MHLKIYDFQSTEDQRNRKKSFKNDFLRIYKEKVQEAKNKKKIDNDDNILDNIPPEEMVLIEDFLTNFVQVSDGSKQDQIDIKLALKALPSHIDENNMHRCELFDFTATSSSLIAFQNDDQDELFKYYDSRNSSRLKKLNNKAGVTKDLTHSLKELGSSVLSILMKIQKTGMEKGRKYAKKNAKEGEFMEINLQEPHVNE